MADNKKLVLSGDAENSSITQEAGKPSIDLSQAGSEDTKHKTTHASQARSGDISQNSSTIKFSMERATEHLPPSNTACPDVTPDSILLSNAKHSSASWLVTTTSGTEHSADDQMLSSESITEDAKCAETRCEQAVEETLSGINISEGLNWEGRLPTEVWLKIAEFLDIEGKYNLSLSCDRLHAICSEPFLWRKQYIVITRSERLARMSLLGRLVLENYGTHCKELIITVFNSELSLDPETLRVLTQFSRLCSGIEKVIIEVTITRWALLELSNRASAFLAVVEILHNATGMVNVVVKQWPPHPPTDDSILPVKALQSGKRVPDLCDGLISLQAFNHFISGTIISKLEMRSLLPFFCFPVRELQLCGCAISDCLLGQLALPAYDTWTTFETLKFNIDTCIEGSDFVQQDSWQKLMAVHPSLKVHVNVLLRGNDPEMPNSKLFGGKDPENVTSKLVLEEMMKQLGQPWVPVERVLVIFPEKETLHENTLEEIILKLDKFPATVNEFVFMALPNVWAASRSTFTYLLTQLKKKRPESHVLLKELDKRLIAKAKSEKAVEEETIHTLKIMPCEEEDDDMQQECDSIAESDIVFEKISELEENPLNIYCFRPPSADRVCPHCSPLFHSSRVWSDK